MRLESRREFIDLTLLSCYDGIYPALKKSGEWTVYLQRNCRFLDGTDGRCSIHASEDQSLICKSYDAHRCWYVDAFAAGEHRTMIPFDTESLIGLERRYRLFERRFDVELDWNEMREAASAKGSVPLAAEPRHILPRVSRRLSFRRSRSDRFLFFPPYQRPANRRHFELLSFRLGFPGLSLAVSDSCWAFLVSTGPVPSRLERFRSALFPAIGHDDGAFSFHGLAAEHHPFTEAGEFWVVLDRSDLEVLRGLTAFDSSGGVRRLPPTTELLAALGSHRPDRAA